MPATVVAIAAIVTNVIRGSPGGGRPPFVTTCASVGVGSEVGVTVGLNMTTVGKTVGVAEGVASSDIWEPAAKTVNHCMIVVNMPAESRVFMVIV